MEIRNVPLLGIAVVMVFTLVAAAFLSRELPLEVSTTFSGSGNCEPCHSPNSTNPSALIDPTSGVDVSPPTLWRSTMMANAAKDPFWQAKVSAEVAANPHLKEVIEDKCTTCHAPTGRTEAASNDIPYSLADMRSDPLAMDGVTCTVCHQIKDENLGTNESFSGKYVIENDRVIYGPFEDQFSPPMNGATNYEPTYSEHVTRSELCATCHTLFTPFVDNQGEIAGEFPEQVPYLEWKNSVYPDLDQQCQDCHMPAIEDEIPIASIPPNMAPRGPFWQHFFVGGNVTMLKMLQANIDSLGITAEEAHFDSTIARTINQLQNETVDLSAAHTWLGDTLALEVTVVNKAGHKLPTGYPSRRMWLWVVVRDAVGKVVFESGEWDEQARIAEADDPLEPHHDVIDAAHKVQIYETVLADVDDAVTYTLLRGSHYVKDNRIPPSGFKMEHADYQPASIAGAALDDSDFNWFGRTEGSGADIVHYRIAGLTEEAQFTAEVALMYQSLAPNWIDDLDAYQTDEIDKFAAYYQEADIAPTSLGSVTVSNIETAISYERPQLPEGLQLGQNYPNPFSSGTTIPIQIDRGSKMSVVIFDLQGRRIRQLFDGQSPGGSLTLDWDGKNGLGVDLPPGAYLVRVIAGSASRSLLVQKGR